MTDKPAGSTNQKKTEQLQSTEERFRTLCNNLPAMVCEFLPDSTLTYVNKTCCDYFNMSEEELLGERFLDFLPEDKIEAAKSHYLPLDSEQLVKTHVQKIPRNDDFLFLEWHTRAIFNEHGQVVRYQAVGIDITERKQAEVEINERIKELKCLQSISETIESGKYLEQILQTSANALSKAFLYSDIICVRISFGDQCFQTENFHETEWHLSADLKVKDKKAGAVEVYYLEERPAKDEGPFLKEERNLINLITERLGSIIERRQTEDALRESEERYRVLFEDADQGILVIASSEDCFTYANPAICRLLGYSLEEMLKLKVTDIHPPEVLDTVFSHFEALAQGKKMSVDNIALLCKDGSVRYVQINGSIIVINGCEYVVGFFTDVTERKETQDALRESEERFKTLASSTTDTVIIADEEGKIVFCNKAAEDMTGYNQDELLGKSFLMLRSPHLREALEKKRVEYVKKGFAENKFIEGSLSKKSGEEIPVEVSTTSWKQGGQLFFGGFIRDMTERKMAEKALLESEKKVSSILNSLEDIVMSFSIPEEKIIYISPSVEKIIGRKVEDLTKKKHVWTDGIHPDDMRIVYDSYYQAGEKDSNESEFRFIRPDGNIRWVRSRLKIVHNEKGEPNRIDWLITDITERKKQEEERLEMERQLLHSQKLESLGVLAGGIAHDFNNILSSIIGYTQICLRLPEKRGHLIEKDLNEILKAGYRAQELVKQILVFSRTGESTGERKVFQLSLLVKEALKLMQGAIPSTIEIQSNIRTSACVLADPTMIHQVIVNLCTNAVYAMKDGVGVLSVNLSDEWITDGSLEVEKGSYVKLAVSDTGCGMSDDVCRRIFEPFFTTKKTEEGTGLGLSVAYGIVKACRGTITVQSMPGEGSIFNVYLPSVGQQPVPEETDHKVVPQGSGELILLVDDESFMLKMGNRFLEEIGYHVETCINPVQALNIFKNRSDEFSLVLTDLTMPKMTGDILVEEMRKIRSDIPVVMFTGYGLDILKERATLAGVKYFVTKPFGQFEIADIIRKALDDRKGDEG